MLTWSYQKDVIDLRVNYDVIHLCKDTLANTANIYLFKINNRITRKRPDVCSMLTIKLPERRHWEYSGEYSLLILNYFTPFLNFSVVDFKQANVCWENYQTFYLFDICFNVSTGGRQDLTRSNVGKSNFFLILDTTTKYFGIQNRAWDCHESISSGPLSFREPYNKRSLWRTL